MDINAYKQVLLDQQKEKNEILLESLTARREEVYFDLNSQLAQIVIGVRRSGKSTLCHKVLKQNNINYAYVNFDDERLYNLKTEDLNDVLEALYMVYGDFKYLFAMKFRIFPVVFVCQSVITTKSTFDYYRLKCQVVKYRVKYSLNRALQSN